MKILQFLLTAIFLMAPDVSWAMNNVPKGKGLVREDPNLMATFRSVPKFRAYLPSRVDLSEFFPPVGSQGVQGSCTAWATGYALRGYYDRRIAAAKGKEINYSSSFSPAFIYNQINNQDSCFAPTRISDALRLLQNQGVVQNRYFPYDPSNCVAQPNKQIIQQAAANKISGWKRVNEKRLDDLKGNLADGHPIVIGIMVDNSFDDLVGDAMYSKIVKNDNAYGHAMVMVGYDEKRQGFKVFNSWGSGWADQGMGWMSYDVVKANLDSAFVMEFDLPPLPKEEVKAPEIKEAKAVQEQKPIKSAPPKPKLKPLMDILKSRVSDFKCFSLNREMSAGKLSQIQGFVSTNTDLRILRNALNIHPDGRSVNLDVSVKPWPQCEALKTFASPLAARQGLTVTTKTEENKPVTTFKSGERLVVRVTTPDFPSYLYVTYLQSGGDAVHLVRGMSKNGKPFDPNIEVTFGNSPDQPRFRIAEPYGDEMIVVLATRKPLFDETYGIVEEERTFLTRFRKGILTKLGRQVVGNVAGVATYLTTTAE